MKQIIPIVIMISLIGIVSAIYSGESITYTPSDLGMESFIGVNITDNVSEIPYWVTYNLVNITIPNDAPTQTFTITFSGYKNGVESSVSFSSGTPTGGGGGLEFIKPKVKKVIPVNETVVPVTNQTTPIIITPEEPATKEFFLWTWLKWIWSKLTFWKN